MSTRNLSYLFRPRSVAVIGASEREHAIGNIVMRNLLEGGFSGPIMPVNPEHEATCGVLTYPTVEALPVVPDLAVICVPAAGVDEQVRRLGERGTRAAIVVAAGLSTTVGPTGKTLLAELGDTARQTGMRILGPNCVGLASTANGLNASWMPQGAVMPGRIAFVSQSGALCTSVLDWARPKGIGFSHFVSLGDAIDIDFGDVLDYLGSDPATRAILLYVESIHQRRNFMSAARAAARNKPVLAIRAGRTARGAKAAATHTGALAGADAVYDAAFRRAGMLRVYDLEEMFTAVETLSRSRPPRGTRLGILTNGGGIGIMALDDLLEQGGKLAEISPATIEKLDKVLPDSWSHANPVDIAGDARGDRYSAALKTLCEAPEVDSVLVLHAPTATCSPVEIAEKVAATVKATKGSVITCWVGQERVAPGRRILQDAGIAAYETPGAAVRAFMHLVEYRKSQEMLMETPPSALADFTPATAAARMLIEKAMADGSGALGDPEAKAVLSAYGIPTVESHIAHTPAEASRIAAQLGTAIALKILSPDISHKSDVGGVRLNLMGPFEVEKAGNLMLERVAAKFPEARIEGFMVQTMAARPGAQELIIGVTTDPIFGPVIMFGQGGVAVEIIKDSAIGLPPLNMTLAHDLIYRTHTAWRLLEGYRDRPPADIDAICLTLMKISQLIIDIPEITELDINPLFADSQGVLAVDTRIRVAPPPPVGQRMAIRPYPKALEEIYTLADKSRVLVRPIRPEDEPNHHAFVSKVTPEDIRFRFFGLVNDLPHSEMARMTQIDYDREMAFIAVPINSQKDETWGVVRAMADPDNERAEFAILVRSDLKGSGLGRLMMLKMIRYCRSRGTGQLIGQVLSDNTRMLGFCESLGFKRLRFVDGNIVEVALDLKAIAKAAQ
jgi:acetyltransferase